MKTEAQILKDEELTQLGNNYHNDPKFVLEEDENSVKIVVPPTPWFQLILMTIILGSFGFVFIYFTHSKAHDFLQKPIGLQILFYLTIILGTFAPITIILFRISYLRKISPILEFDKRNKMISLHKGKITASVENIFAILALKVNANDPCGELQLIIEINGIRSKHLIATSSNTGKHAFGHIIKEFGHLTGIQTILADSGGFFEGSKIKVSILTPNKHKDK